MTYEFMMLWGFSPSQREPIKLSGGSLRHCRNEQTRRESQGWTCAIYAFGVAPVGLRIMSAQL